MQTSVVSFGYKHGVPLDVDLVFDCRFLPNPHWVEALRPLSGLDDPVRDFVLGQPEAGPFLDKVDDLWSGSIPAFVREGKSYLTIALGLHRRAATARSSWPRSSAGRLEGSGISTAIVPPGHRPVTPVGDTAPGVAGRLGRSAEATVPGGRGRWRPRHGGDARRRTPLRRQVTAVVSVADDGGLVGTAARGRSTSWRSGTCASAWWPWPSRTPSLAAAFEHRFEAGASWSGTPWATWSSPG